MRLSRSVLLSCAIFYFLSQILFLVNIQFPRGYNFDEFHYVPAAKELLAFERNRNWEHPPLGKEILAAGIALGGDRPIGWRLMSSIFGALTLVGMYLWALALFRDQKIARWAALLTLVNQLLYVQARIGMLDTFMFAFVVWGLAAYTAAWSPERDARTAFRLMCFAGLMFGLGMATKWSAVVPWLSCVALIVGIKTLQRWGTTFRLQREDDWYQPTLWNGLTAGHWLIALGFIPVTAYLLPFIPLLFLGGPHPFTDLFKMQLQMWDGQLRVVTAHPYMSTWKDWAILKRPIWYAFDREGLPVGAGVVDKVRGVIMLGNPLIMWAGLLSVFACLWGWLREKRRDAFLIFCFYGMFYFSWIVIPRKVSFYYYYYPAGMVLSLALAYVFHRGERGPWFRWGWARLVFLGASIGIFVHFFPILAALPVPSDSLRKWLWFQSWI